MKTGIFCSSFLCIFIWSCNYQSRNSGNDISADIVDNQVTASGMEKNAVVAAIKFEEIKYDFGKIVQGEKAVHSFRFKNEGEKDLVISGVSSACGCTVPSWPREPIPPGESGSIGVVFDSEEKNGRQEKGITVVTNSIPNTSVLIITAEVMVP